MARQLMHRPQRFALLAALVGTLTMSPRTVSAQAYEFTLNLYIPLTFYNVPGCGELVSGTGTLHIVLHQTYNAAGGSLVVVHAQLQGASVVGTSGATYKLIDVSQSESTSNGPGAQSETTIVANYLLISEGTAPNYDMHQTTHITMNDNGEVTAVVDNTTVECRG